MTQTQTVCTVPRNLGVSARFCTHTLLPPLLLGGLGKISVGSCWESKVMQLSIDNWSLHSSLTFSLPALYRFWCVLGLKLIFNLQHRWSYCESIFSKMKLLSYADEKNKQTKKNLCITGWSHDSPACKSILCYLQRDFTLNEVQKLYIKTFFGEFPHLFFHNKFRSFRQPPWTFPQNNILLAGTLNKPAGLIIDVISSDGKAAPNLFFFFFY